MDNIALGIGRVVLLMGGSVLAVGIIGLVGWLASIAWIAFSDSFRDICKAESLIFEYRKHREEFMAWKALKDGDGNA